MRLSDSMLEQRNADIEHLSYDRARITKGWVHIGLGAFHRAHQSWYLDQLNAQLDKTGQDNNWGLVVANIRNDIGNTVGQLVAQDGLYTLTTVDENNHQEHGVVRSILEAIDAVSSPSALLDRIADDDTNVVSLTVTEGGYYQRNSDSELDLQHPVIVEELGGKQWQTVYSYLIEGLKQRMQTGAKPLTILCCDNLRGNGHRLDASLQKYMEALNETDLKAWYQENVSCPNTMVDRITPRPSDEYENILQEKYDYIDKAQVMAEPFCQWVIEDNFKTTRPPLDAVGVEFVADVEPYEEVKIRILNAGHLSLAYLSALRGHEFFDQGMRDEKLREFFDAFQSTDVLPLMPEVPVDKQKYLTTVTNRFLNAGIGDTVARLCSESYSKFPAFILPTLKSGHAQNASCDYSFAIIASYLQYLQADKDGKMEFSYDEQYKEFTDAIVNSDNPENALIRDSALWGELTGTEFMTEGLVRGKALLLDSGLVPI